jgi:isopenicillin N synthase-like dioxygenase
MQIHSGGLLQATPHFVRSASSPAAAGVSRNTFAVFMQPRWDEPMEPPGGCSSSSIGVGQWKPGMTFGDFAEATIAHNYA